MKKSIMKEIAEKYPNSHERIYAQTYDQAIEIAKKYDGARVIDRVKQTGFWIVII